MFNDTNELNHKQIKSENHLKKLKERSLDTNSVSNIAEEISRMSYNFVKYQECRETNTTNVQ